MHFIADPNVCFVICQLTMRAGADVPGHAGSALPCPPIRPHTNTVLRGHLQVPDHHILTDTQEQLAMQDSTIWH